MFAIANISRPAGANFATLRNSSWPVIPTKGRRHMTQLEALLLLAAFISNFSWLWPVRDRWFAND